MNTDIAAAAADDNDDDDYDVSMYRAPAAFKVC